MRIIKAPAQPREFETTCQDPKCKTEVALEANDLTFRADPRDGNAVSWLCPTCGRDNWVDVKLVPANIVRAVKK